MSTVADIFAGETLALQLSVDEDTQRVRDMQKLAEHAAFFQSYSDTPTEEVTAKLRFLGNYGSKRTAGIAMEPLAGAPKRVRLLSKSTEPEPFAGTSRHGWGEQCQPAVSNARIPHTVTTFIWADGKMPRPMMRWAWLNRGLVSKAMAQMYGITVEALRLEGKTLDTIHDQLMQLDALPAPTPTDEAHLLRSKHAHTPTHTSYAK
jgi:hypothetical protein